MNTLRFLFTLPVLLIAILSPLDIKSTVPYLYFYSEKQSAFLVERADGTEISVLAPYKLPANHIIGGPSWSSSGRYFAWFSSSEYGPYPEKPTYAFLVDEQRRTHSLLSGLGEISLMKWSPKTDLLLVTREVVTETSTKGSILEMYIFDESANPVLKKEFYKADVLTIEWSPSGGSILVYLQTDASEKDGIFKIENVALDAKIQTYDFYQSSAFCSFPKVSISNALAYFDLEKNLILESLTDRDAKLRINLQSKIPRFIDWSPNGKYALVYMTSTCQEMMGQVWFLSIESKELKFLADAVTLPEFPYLNRLMALDSQVYPYSTWSPNNEYSLFRTYSRIILFDSKSAKTRVIDPTLSHEGEPHSFKWASNNLMMFDWASIKFSVDHIYAYNVLTAEIQLLVIASDELTPRISYFSLSADQTYLAYTYSDQCGDLCIVNLTTKNQLPIVFQTDMTTTKSIDEIIWHPNQNWLFVLGDIDTGSGLRQVNVVNANATSQMVLGQCRLGTSCFGWLPNN